MWNKECVSISFSATSGLAGAKSTMYRAIQGAKSRAVLSVLSTGTSRAYAIPQASLKLVQFGTFPDHVHTIWAFKHYWLTGLCCPFPRHFYSLVPWALWFCRSIASVMEHNLNISLLTERQLVKTSETHWGKMLYEEKITWVYLVHHSDKLWLKYTCQRLSWVKTWGFFRLFFFLLINDSSTSLTKTHIALLEIKTTVAAEGFNVLIEMSVLFVVCLLLLWRI